MTTIKMHKDYGYDLSDVKECIEYSKNVIIGDLMEEGGVPIEEIWSIIHKLRHDSIKLATALATVLTAGYIMEKDGTFNMPSTEKCLAEFKAVGKLLKKYKPLYAVEWDCDYGEDEGQQHYSETTRVYKLTHRGMSVAEEVKEY